MLFADAGKGDYTLPKECDVFQIGFENIPLDRFGVYSLDLKEKAHSPEFPEIRTMEADNDVDEYNWLGAKIRIIKGLGDRSAYGLPDEKGCIVLKMDNAVNMQDAGLKENDVIYAIYGEDIDSVETLMRLTNKYKWKKTLLLECFRNQQKLKISLVLD